MEKLKRLVERPFGEVLFADLILMGDGATERAFLPVVLRAALGPRAHGLCVIDPQSLDNDVAHAAVKFADSIGTPWLVFADGDSAGRTAVEHLLAQAGGDQSERVVWIESDATVAAGAATAFERMMRDFDEGLCRDVCLELRGADPTTDADTLTLLTKAKGYVGGALARELVHRYPDPAGWPDSLRTLVERLDAML